MGCHYRIAWEYAFGEDSAWFLPYYLDIGTVDSDLTWQAFGGVGYTFGWGQLVAVWRYMDYELDSKGPLDDMNFSDPAIGAVWRW